MQPSLILLLAKKLLLDWRLPKHFDKTQLITPWKLLLTLADESGFEDARPWSDLQFSSTEILTDNQHKKH